LEEINLKIKKGSLTTILSRTSGGKSTFLKSIIKELRFSEGEILIDGDPVIVL
jgi:ABC-type cobalamin/Fe3+-siderophores transport system ATPase subunit